MKGHIRALGLALGICAALPAAPTAMSSARAGEPALNEIACPEVAAMDVRLSCLRLDVPEDRARADSHRLSLTVYVLELRFPERPTGSRISEVRRSGLTLLYLHGGPGSRLFFDRRAALESWIEGLKAMKGANVRRLVLFGQRGTEGARAETLSCPEVRALELSARADSEVREAFRAALSQCRARIEDAGLAFAGYRTEATVRDLTALRRALDIREWDILAASYGARVAVMYAYEEPDAVRSLTLDSPDPWDGMQQFRIADHVMDSLAVIEIICRRHTRCTGGRRTVENFRDLVESARERPLPIPVASPGSAPTVQEFGPARLIGTVYDALHRPADALRLPAALAAARDGDFAPLGALLATLRAPGNTPVFATNALVNCTDLRLGEIAATLERQMRKKPLFREFLKTRLTAITETCEVFGGERTAAMPGGRPMTVPVLILSGKLDPVTPYDAAGHVAGLFSRARIKQYETLSHGVLADSMCAWSDVSRFLRDPASRGRGPRGSFLVCRDPVPEPDLFSEN